MSVSGYFLNTSNLYRYSLNISYKEDSLIINRATLISALHKTERRRKSGIRLFLVLGFFNAVSKLDSEELKRAQGAITNFLNRFAVCI